MSEPAKSDYAYSGDFGDQLQLDGLGHVAGTQWRRKGGGAVTTLLAVNRRRREFLIIRASGEEREISAEQFDRDYEPFRHPTGECVD